MALSELIVEMNSTQFDELRDAQVEAAESFALLEGTAVEFMSKLSSGIGSGGLFSGADDSPVALGILETLKDLQQTMENFVDKTLLKDKKDDKKEGFKKQEENETAKEAAQRLKIQSQQGMSPEEKKQQEDSLSSLLGIRALWFLVGGAFVAFLGSIKGMLKGLMVTLRAMGGKIRAASKKVMAVLKWARLVIPKLFVLIGKVFSMIVSPIMFIIGFLEGWQEKEGAGFAEQLTTSIFRGLRKLVDWLVMWPADMIKLALGWLIEASFGEEMKKQWDDLGTPSEWWDGFGESIELGAIALVDAVIEFFTSFWEKGRQSINKLLSKVGLPAWFDEDLDNQLNEAMAGGANVQPATTVVSINGKKDEHTHKTLTSWKDKPMSDLDRKNVERGLAEVAARDKSNAKDTVEKIDRALEQGPSAEDTKVLIEHRERLVREHGLTDDPGIAANIIDSVKGYMADITQDTAITQNTGQPPTIISNPPMKASQSSNTMKPIMQSNGGIILVGQPAGNNMDGSSARMFAAPPVTMREKSTASLGYEDSMLRMYKEPSQEFNVVNGGASSSVQNISNNNITAAAPLMPYDNNQNGGGRKFR
jgi:hypothetical protein